MSEHPYTRGKHNAEAIIEESGKAWATRWLLDRMACASKEALHPEYIRGYRFALEAM